MPLFPVEQLAGCICCPTQPTTASHAVISIYSSYAYAGLNFLIASNGAAQQVAAILASTDHVVRMRAVSLVFGLAGQSQPSMTAVQKSGINLYNTITNQSNVALFVPYPTANYLISRSSLTCSHLPEPSLHVHLTLSLTIHCLPHLNPLLPLLRPLCTSASLSNLHLAYD